MSRKKKGSRQVVMPKSDKDRMRIVISADKMNQMRKASEREQRREAGDVMGRAGRGGIHGGGKREINRRDRKASRDQVRNYETD